MGPLAKILAFLFWGNFLPPFANILLGDRFNLPLDNHTTFRDGQPLFGVHKTFRGIAVCILGCTLVGPLLDLSFPAAATAALLLMTGDLISSFIKRRLHFESGTACFGLDQFFEGLLPSLFLVQQFQLSLWYLVIILAVFIPVAHLGAHFWKKILTRPPVENYPRIIRSTVRLREWRSCHQPLARWQTIFNLSSLLYNRVLVGSFFRLIGLYERGMTNARNVQVGRKDLTFGNLPPGLEGFRILLLTDLHLDGLPGITENILEAMQGLEADLCLIGGDIRMRTYGPIAPCLRELRKLLGNIHCQYGIYGVLGNHDCIEMAPDFEEAGIMMLINDAVKISHGQSSFWLAGIDDPHYYRCHDTAKALGPADKGAFTIFVAHSPEAYADAADGGADLYLCGHTHGGQICLPGGTAVYTNSRAPRFTAAGHWQYKNMQGYTSRGAGASGAPLRFNCPGEITVLTLHKTSSGPE